MKPSSRVALLGVPLDENSSFLRGAAQAPSAIRAALVSASTNLSAESGLDLGAEGVLEDLGDLRPGEMPEAFARIEAAVASAVAEHDRLILLGGDHSITYPILKGFSRRYGPLAVVQFDAHPDLYDSFGGNRLSHACPFARCLEDGLCRRLVQVGIRASNRHQQEQIGRFGVEVVTMEALSPELVLELDGPAYLSFDLDCLDPAFVPGVAHHEPGGLTTREALRLLGRSRLDLVGADIVELNPGRDRDGVTAMTAAKLLKEIAAKMLARTA